MRVYGNIFKVFLGWVKIKVRSDRVLCRVNLIWVKVGYMFLLVRVLSKFEFIKSVLVRVKGFKGMSDPIFLGRLIFSQTLGDW